MSLNKNINNPTVSSILSRLGKDSAIYGISGTIGKVFGFLLLPLITRIFTPEQYGLIELITVLCSFIAVFVLAGMNNAQMIFYYDENIKKEDVLLTNTLFFFIWGSILYTSFFLLHSMVSGKYFTNPISNILLSLGLLSSFLILLNNHFASIFRLIMQPWKFLTVNVIGVVLTYSLMIYFIVFRSNGLNGFFLAKIFASFFILFISLFFLKKYINGTFSWVVLKKMLIVGIPLIPTDLGTALINLSDRFFINKYLSIEEVGLYGIGVRIASMVLFFTYAFRLAWPPIAMSIKEAPNAQYIFSKLIQPFFLLGSFISIMICGLAKPILIIMTQPDYYDAYKCVGYFTYSIWWASSYFVSGLGLYITKKTKFFSIGILISGIFGIGLNILLIPIFGISGAALATCLSHFIGNTVVNYYSNKVYPLGLSSLKLFLILCITLISLMLQLMFYEFEFSNFLLSFSIIIIWIISFFILTRLIPKEDRLIIKNLVTKYFG